MNFFTKLFRPRGQSQSEVTAIPVELRSSFSTFSGTAYENAIFRGAVDTIAKHAAKLKPRTVPTIQRLDRLLQVEPNPYMTAYDLLYKVVTAYFCDNNAFLLIHRDEEENVTALYNLSPVSVEFLQSGETLYCKFRFANGESVILPYSDVIHLRRHFAKNELLGSDNGPLFPALETAHAQSEGIRSAIQNGVTIRGILKHSGILKDEKLKESRDLFVNDYLKLCNNGGLAAVDAKFDYVPITTTPVIVDPGQLAAVQNQIYAYLNVSAKIVSGEYSEDEFAAFYESTIEPLALQMSLEFSRKLFTPRERAFGREILFGSERLAVPYDPPAEVDGYTEIVRAGALDGVNLEGVILCCNHNMTDVPLARSPKTLTLTVTETGLVFRAVLPDTEQGRAVYTAVQRGDLTKMSFAFAVAEGGETFENNTRTITKIDHIFEISPVNFPAYEDTAVFVRSKGAVTNVQQYNPITGASFETGSVETCDAAYKTAFFKSMLGQTLTAAETRAYSAGRAEKRADAFNTLTNSAAVVPDTTLDEILSKARQLGGLFAEVRLFSIPSNVTVPVGTPTAKAAWHTEGAAVDRQKADVNPVSFSGYELIKIFSLSVAAKRMSITAFERYISEELVESLRAAIGDAIVSGTGTGQPTGILTGITWDAANSIETATSTGDNIVALMGLLPRGYGNGAKFALSSHTLYNRIYGAKTTTGEYIFTKDNQNDTIQRLFGFPIVIDDYIDDDVILFGNFKYYGVNIPEGIAVEVSRESGFTSGLIDYRAMAVADGKPLVPEAFVKLTITGAGA